MPKKKSANYFKFAKEMRRICGPCNGPGMGIAEVTRRQFGLFVQGIRDHRVSDAAVYAWNLSGGEW